jgi:maltose alpha-D-glucosyltransferase/alpha-amylase
MLHLMCDFLQWRRRDAILLAEANVPPNESMDYFGENGERLQMMLNFPVNQRVFYAPRDRRHQAARAGTGGYL